MKNSKRIVYLIKKPRGEMSVPSHFSNPINENVTTQYTNDHEGERLVVDLI